MSNFAAMQRLVLLSFCALALATRAADSRPNILLCLADDASWYHFGANGDKICRTPPFDRVALEGVNFTRAFCSSPSCTPSRGALLTGQDFWRLEDGANLWSRWPNRFAVYPDLLAKAGYHVGLKGFEIERFDRDISAMLKLLEDAGQLGNTLVVVTSDNGFPFPRGKATCYDAGTRMPLAVRWPARAKGGRAVDDFVSLTDLAPTFLEAAGLKPLPEMTGHSLLSPPNVVFILADDLGPNDLACYGRREHHTPNLDRLAAEGSRFTCAYVAQPICSPSRAAILTGKTPARLHLTTYLPGRPDCPSQKLLHPVIEQQLPLAEKTLAECLHDAGYATACVGKWHLGGTGFLPTDQGFDLYHPGNAVTSPSSKEGGKGEYDLSARAIEFMEKNRDRPFFLYLAHNSPHIPYSAKPELVAKNAATFEPVYAALIETLDDTVGLLLARIETLGLRDRTLVIFTSDHGGLHVPEGPHARITHNTPFRAGKGYLYEGGLRVPLIVRWPGHVPAKRVVDTPVINTDWLPTLTEIAGARTPRDLDGVSIAPLLVGRGQPKPRPFYWHFPHYTNQGSQPAGAIRDGDWKLVEHYEDGRTELFNLANDIREATDLSARESRRVARLKRQLAAWRQRVGAQTNAQSPNFDSALHRNLYLDFTPSAFDPLHADAETWARVAEWRRQMDAVLRKPKAPPLR